MPLSLAGGDFTAVREVITEAFVLELSSPGQSAKFTIGQGSSYRFAQRQPLPPEVVTQIAERVPKFKEKYIDEAEFPKEAIFPVLNSSPKVNAVYVFLDEITFLDDDTIEICIGRLHPREGIYPEAWDEENPGIAVFLLTYSVTKKDGQWIFERTGFSF